MTSNKIFWNFVISITIIIISSIALSNGYRMAVENHFDVPGTVIGKSEVVTGSYRIRRMRTEWHLAVRPDNKAYKPYDVHVDFLTFSTYNVGSHGSFRVSSEQVDPNGHGDFLALTIFIFGICGLMIGLVRLCDNVGDLFYYRVV